MAVLCVWIIVGIILLIQIAGRILHCYSFQGESMGTKILHCLYPGAVLLILFFDGLKKRLIPWSSHSNTEFYEKIYVGEDSKTVRKKCIAYIISAGMMVLLVTAGVVIALKFSGIYRTEIINTIKRPAEGEEEFDAVAQWGDSSFDISLTINEPYPSREQMLDRIQYARDNLKVSVLGVNESLDSVRTDLVLEKSYAGWGVEISWKSSDSSLVHTDGTVDNEEMLRPRLVELTAVITCYEESAEEKLLVTVLPPGEETVMENFLINSMEELLEQNKTEEEIEIPDELMGQPLSFTRPKEDESNNILLLGVVVVLLLIPLWYQNKGTQMKERENQLLNDYPELTGKMVMLLEAGVGVRPAFERIVSDYEKRKNKRNKRYVYEEMLKAKNELALGRNESEVYERFGIRCGNIFYIRFAALLAQAVKKGSESLSMQLRKESSESIKERQQLIKKRGEEASVKLLLPMMGMFVLVLAIILVPAFI
ncbi:MAG: immunoglobulin-like domain-containing protein [Lachnospiraceae bacterium]